MRLHGVGGVRRVPDVHEVPLGHGIVHSIAGGSLMTREIGYLKPEGKTYRVPCILAGIPPRVTNYGHAPAELSGHDHRRLLRAPRRPVAAPRAAGRSLCRDTATQSASRDGRLRPLRPYPLCDNRPRVFGVLLIRSSRARTSKRRRAGSLRRAPGPARHSLAGWRDGRPGGGGALSEHCPARSRDQTPTLSAGRHCRVLDEWTVRPG